MSDENMLLHHLSDSYHEAVSNFRARQEEKEEENRLSKFFFGWVLRDSEFDEINANKSDDKEKSPPSVATNDDDSASVDTEGTAEIDSDDEWDDGSLETDNDSDWDDTYSLSSNEEDTVTSRKVVVDYSSTVFCKPGDFYFTPTAEDFPIERKPPPMEEHAIERPESPVQQQAEAISTDSVKEEEKQDFWGGFLSNMEKFKSFADDAIQDFGRKAEDARRKGEEDARKKAEEARKELMEARRKEDAFRRQTEDALRQANEAKEARRRRRKARRHAAEDNSVSSSTTSLSDASSFMFTSFMHEQESVAQVHPLKRSPSQLSREVQSFSLRTVQDMRNSFSRSRRETMETPAGFRQGFDQDGRTSLKKSPTRDNLAEYFAESDKLPSIGIDSRSENVSVAPSREAPGPRDKFNSLMDATKEAYNTKMKERSERRESARSKEGKSGPSHRRTRSQRLIPSALAKNDFPWY